MNNINKKVNENLKNLTNENVMEIIKNYFDKKQLNFIIKNKKNYWLYIISQKNLIDNVNELCEKKCLTISHNKNCEYNKTYLNWDFRTYKFYLLSLNNIILDIKCNIIYNNVNDYEIAEYIDNTYRTSFKLEMHFDIYDFRMNYYGKGKLINFYEKFRNLSKETGIYKSMFGDNND